MRTWVVWVKAAGAVVAAAGAVGIALARLTGSDASALTWYWVWLPGAAIWLVTELAAPSPGYRFVSRPPFLRRRAEVADLGHRPPQAPAARRIVRAAFAVHTAALAVFVVAEVVEAVTPAG